MSDDVTMRLQTKKFGLQVVLEKAANVLPTRDVMPVLKNVLVEASASDEGGRLRVAATDLELSVLAETDLVTVEVPGTVLFPGKRLLEIVKEAEDDDLVLTVTGRKALVEVGRSQWSLQLPDDSEYPNLPDEDGAAFTAVPRALMLDGLSAVRYAVAKESIRSTLMMVDVSDGRMRAADGARFQQVAAEGVPDMQIPAGAVDDLVKLLRASEASKIEVAEDEDHLLFRLGHDTFVCNKLVSEFPNVDEMLLKPALTNDWELHVDRDELVAGVKRARITSDPDSNAISIVLNDDLLTIISRDKQNNVSQVRLDCSWSHGRHEIGLNHKHLVEMLMMAPSKDCHFFLSSADTKTRKGPILMRHEDSGLLSVLNQIRLDWVT